MESKSRTLAQSERIYLYRLLFLLGVRLGSNIRILTVYYIHNRVDYSSVHRR